MAKIATDVELAAIITGIVTDAPQHEEPRYRMFLDTIAEAIGAYHCLAVGAVMTPAEDLTQWTVALHATMDTADDGGPFAPIDTDLKVKEWLAEGQTETEETR
ncbi:hypothetical protein AruPA_19205 [Acidiphilium sp. PA]|jgi:hypothetical protein|uniref:hypothetical protein n=1 Tax=Acidiphilium TaxID=522 RepID=UPI002243AD46|nr:MULTISPECIES: hypothetical protein [Acidiphilium]MCW8309165.1 hypothetical protein [Acidiphilium sp. PA]HQT86571.1 hypothetical protein [Acidiphilium rubrum]HQT86593.1 hypothetical protein [Acidiphilium rubrum]HQT86679.1 hypothetical protein [Acidiphilium rubrum]